MTVGKMMIELAVPVILSLKKSQLYPYHIIAIANILKHHLYLSLCWNDEVIRSTASVLKFVPKTWKN